MRSRGVRGIELVLLLALSADGRARILPTVPISPAPRTPDEPARLAALTRYGVLDTPREQDFDEVAELASAVCGTPIAVVNLVGEGRQFFKAEVGLGVRETPLDSSFCARAILEEDFLLVPDATKDPRFDCNPLVTGEPHLRFYAGALLKTEDGQAIGTVCVLDYQPRDLTDVQQQTLRVLARQVMKQLELRRALRERSGSEARLDMIARASAALLTAADPVAALWPILERGAASIGFEQSYAYDLVPGEKCLALVHAIGADEARRAFLRRISFDVPLCGIVAERGQALILENIQASVEPRHAIARDSGLNAFAGFPLSSRGRLFGVVSFASATKAAFDDDALSFFATMARMVSIARERLDREAELRANEERSRNAQEAGRVGTFEVNIDTGLMSVSPQFALLYGKPATGLYSAETFEALILPEDRHVSSTDETRQAGTAASDVEYRIRRADDGAPRWIARRASFVRDEAGRVTRMFGTVQDITDRKAAESRRDALLVLGDRLRDIDDVPTLVQAAAEILARNTGASRAGYGVVDAGRETVDVLTDWCAPGSASVAGLHSFRTYGSYIEDLKRGEVVAIDDVTRDPRTRDGAAALIAIGVRVLLNVPIVVQGQLVGIGFAYYAHAHTFTDDELAFVRTVADRVQTAVARVRAEADQRLLNEEISHRLKNTLAMVLSIAGQTLRNIPDRTPVEVFEQRIHALSSAHDVLLRRSWAAAPAKDVVEAVMASAGHGDRIEVSGPDLDLGPRATLSLSLLLHELATNAAKYGALSVPSGWVAVDWRLDGEGEDREVTLDWTERGGPAVAPPASGGRKGFGSRLISVGLAGTGGVDLRYPPSGFQATMRAPLIQLQLS